MITLPAGTLLGPYETRDEWLAARKQGIGGSDIGTILGLSTFSSALEVFYEKTGIGEGREVNEAMEIGAAIEPWILERYGDTAVWAKERYEIVDDLYIIQSNDHPWLLHSPDALLLDGIDSLPCAGIEIKNIRSDQHWDPLPPFYMAQVQHGLLCSGLERWIVVALVGGQKLITREIEPDKELQGRIIVEGEWFWTSHVLANVPPEPDGSESASDALNRRWDASHGNVEVDPSLFIQLRAADREVKAAERHYAKIQQVIKSKMGDSEVALTPDGERVATWKVSTRTSVDTKRLKEEEPKIAEKFSRTTPTRIFRPNL